MVMREAQDWSSHLMVQDHSWEIPILSFSWLMEAWKNGATISIRAS